MDNNAASHRFLDLRAADEAFADELVRAAERVIRSGRYIGGPEVEALEHEMTALTGMAHCVGVGNGLDALRLTLRAFVAEGRLKPGDEVIVPANTYIASVLAIIDAGLTPRLIDPDPATMVITGEAVEDAITPRVRALMLVHLYGRTAWDDTMRRVVEKHNFTVVEDCAQSIGARSPYAGLTGLHQTGALGHAAAFSFYPTKNVGALGDAGAVVTPLPEIARTVRALANYGSDRRYHNILPGFNSRLDPIQAAMIRVKLPHLRQLNAERFGIAMAYRNTIANPHITLPPVSKDVTDCVWHQYVITTPYRDRLRDFLRANGVETDVHYPTPVHLQPCMVNVAHGPLPMSERLAREAVSLPITPGSTAVIDAVEIARIINRFDPKQTQ